MLRHASDTCDSDLRLECYQKNVMSSCPQAKEVTDKMFASAAQRLADYVPKESFDEGKIYPDLPDLRDISLKARLLRDQVFQPRCR